MSTAIARSRALRGAAWLDQVRPGWDEYVDLTELDLADSEYCVLGQVFEDDAIYADSSTGWDWATREFRDEIGDTGERFGFDSGNSKWVSYAELDQAWIELIETRRAQREAYATYAQNIEISKAYAWADGIVDEIVLNETEQPRIITVADIARDLIDS